MVATFATTTSRQYKKVVWVTITQTKNEKKDRAITARKEENIMNASDKRIERLKELIIDIYNYALGAQL